MYHTKIYIEMLEHLKVFKWHFVVNHGNILPSYLAISDKKTPLPAVPHLHHQKKSSLAKRKLSKQAKHSPECNTLFTQSTPKGLKDRRQWATIYTTQSGVPNQYLKQDNNKMRLVTGTWQPVTLCTPIKL